MSNIPQKVMKMKTVKDLLEGKGVFFYDKGRHYLMRCLNPEHEDKNPSMSVDKDTGRFKCWSCGFSGGYGSLLKALGEEASDEFDVNQIKAEILRKKCEESYGSYEEVIVDFPAIYYLLEHDWRGISVETLNEFSVFISNQEEFQGRIWIPVKHGSKLIGFQGRAHVEGLEPKYKFYPSHLLIKPVIFGINSVPGHTVVLVEGIVDMLRLRSVGVREACCIFGSHFPFDKLLTLQSYNISSVVTMFDGDKAGKSVTTQTTSLIRKYAPNIIVENIWLPDNQDPGDIDYSDLRNLLYSTISLKLQKVLDEK